MTNVRSQPPMPTRRKGDHVKKRAGEPRVVSMLKKLGIHVEDMSRHEAAVWLFEREVVCVMRHSVEFVGEADENVCNSPTRA
jgi:hypothetical protein